MAVTDLPREHQLSLLSELAQQLRVDSVRMAAQGGSGHPTSSLSAADLMAVLLANWLRYDIAHPEDPHNDELIFSKGHASPLLYALLRAAGAISETELFTYRQLGSRLEGHPTPRLPWVKVATGSLGQGLPAGVGLALTGARLDKLPYRVWVLCGDSELAEGAMWEAIAEAGYAGLANLTAIVDVNRLGQRGPTRWGWDTAVYARQFRAFDWHTIEIDGHQVDEIDQAYAEATATVGVPTVILARTIKGKGAPEAEDRGGYHGKPLPDPKPVIEHLGGVRQLVIPVALPERTRSPHTFPTRSTSLPRYEPGQQVPTRNAFGEALVALGDSDGGVVVLDGEVSDSTRTEQFEAAHPERFFQLYIAEQQLVAAATGMQARGWRPYLATFGAFLTRAHDFLRMAAISRANLRVIGSHAGVEIGADGPSQMGLEDLAMFRAIHGSTVLYPCDANQTTQLVRAMADRAGICYLRTTRGATPVIYDPDDTFPIGGSRLLRSSPEDQVTLVAAGVTVAQALTAADELAADGITARVLDLYSVKPIDADTLRTAVRETGRLVTVEDHWPEGGLGDAVLEVFTDGDSPLPRVRKLAVRRLPGSATPAEQLAAAGIDAAAIVQAARGLVES